MSDAGIFAAIILVVILLALVFGVGIKKLPAWAKSKAGKGALASMALGVAVILITGLLAEKAQAQSALDTRYGNFLNNAYVFAGIDQTRKVSPQCVAGSQSDHMTSNMGMGINVWQSPSRRVALDVQWTHHSCVLGVDQKSYDGLGLRVTWMPWVR